jgi:hypothetical protein
LRASFNFRVQATLFGQATPLGARQLDHRRAVPGDLTPVGTEDIQDYPHGGGLTGAIGPEQAEYLTELLREVLDFDHVRLRLLIPLKPNQDQTVIPMRKTDAIIQRMKGVIGSAPVCELILVKATIPMRTTAMVNPRGILMDNLISFILVSFVLIQFACQDRMRQ